MGDSFGTGQHCDPRVGTLVERAATFEHRFGNLGIWRAGHRRFLHLHVRLTPISATMKNLDLGAALALVLCALGTPVFAQSSPLDRVAMRALAIRAVHADTTTSLLLVSDSTREAVDMTAVASRLGNNARHVGKTAQPGANELGVESILVGAGTTSAEVRVKLWGVRVARPGHSPLKFGAGYLVTLVKTDQRGWRVLKVVEEWTS
jgi:hypothetical protein